MEKRIFICREKANPAISENGKVKVSSAETNSKRSL